MTYNETQKFIISHDLECEVDYEESKELFQVAKETNKHVYDNLVSRTNGLIDVDDLVEYSSMSQHATVLEVLSTAIWRSVNELILETLEEIETIKIEDWESNNAAECDHGEAKMRDEL